MLVVAAALLILIKASGIPLVNYTIYLNPNSTVVNVDLPAQPIQGTLEVINDSDGSLVPASMYSNGSLTIFAFGGGYVSILYYANYTVNTEELTYYFNVSSPTKFDLAFPSNIIIMNLPSTVLGYSKLNNSVDVTLPPGQYYIEYVYVPTTQSNYTATVTSSATIATTTATKQASPPSTTTQQSSPPPSQTSSTGIQSTSISVQPSTQSTQPLQSHSGSTRELAILIVVIILAVMGAVIVYARRNKQLPETLDDVDKAILDALRENGGSLYQSQLQQLTNIPKTTLWRHVQRLQERGLVKVDKVSGQNRVTLQR